jgi:hypothetical protein
MPKQYSDGRHDVSDEMLKELQKVAYAQDNFGMDKYGEPLHHSYNYDWLAMTFEEIADGLKYIKNEMNRRRAIRNYLVVALHSENWEFVKKALQLLEINGTGEHKETHS